MLLFDGHAKDTQDFKGAEGNEVKIMSSIKLTRLTNGMLLFVGLLWFKPLAYFVAVMMIVAGLTGVCLMERMFRKLGLDAGCGSN